MQRFNEDWWPASKKINYYVYRAGVDGINEEFYDTFCLALCFNGTQIFGFYSSAAFQ